jgi:glycosyltransferase involved in cell wall biosynthesis
VWNGKNFLVVAKVNRAEGLMKRQKPGWLFVLPWGLEETGGVNHVVKSLIQRFRDGGEFEPHVLITCRLHGIGRTSGADGGPTCLDLWSPVDANHPARSVLSFVYRWPGRYRKLWRILDRDNIAVVNLHFPSLNALMFLTLRTMRRFRPEIILSFHGSDVKNILEASRLERLLWRIVLRKVDGIAVVSESLAEELMTLEPGIARKLATINSGVDLPTFAVEACTANPREARCVKTIVSIGAFSSIKGHDVLVRAFALVLERVPDCRLVLVGKRGPEFGPIRELVSRLHLERHVSLHADVPHERIAGYLGQAQLFVLASRREGFPLVLAEAAAARLPIVCTNVGGTEELIRDGVTGRLVRSGDPTSLANAIGDLLSDPHNAERIAANCYEYVKSNLTWEHSYRKYLELASQPGHSRCS